MSNRTMILSGERVGLSEMTEADQSLFQKWLSEQNELRAWIDDPRVPTMEDQMKWFKRVQEPDRKMLSVVVLPEGTLIGNGGFVDIDPEKKTAQVRITLGNPDYRGKGYGTEATKLLVRYGFETMGLSNMWLRVLSNNERAIATYEKVGFEHVGPERIEKNGVVKEMMRMEISQELGGSARHGG